MEKQPENGRKEIVEAELARVAEKYTAISEKISQGERAILEIEKKIQALEESCAEGISRLDTNLPDYDNLVSLLLSIHELTVSLLKDLISQMESVITNLDASENEGVELFEEGNKLLELINAAGQVEGPNSSEPKVESPEMNLLRGIEAKSSRNEALSKEELSFLYGFNTPFQSPAYLLNPKTKEIRSKRNESEDASILLELLPEEIAWSREEINAATKAYVGPFFPGVWETGVKDIYTELSSEGQRTFQLQTGKIPRDQLRTRLEEGKVYVNHFAGTLLDGHDFKSSQDSEEVQLLRITLGELGCPDNSRIDQIHSRAQELGLQLCPADVGPLLSLKYRTLSDTNIGMEPIANNDGIAGVFGVSGGGALAISAQKDDWVSLQSKDYILFRLPTTK